MEDNKGQRHAKQERWEESTPFAPLAHYDDQAALQVQELRGASEALAHEKETMTAELDRLTAQLEFGDKKGRLKALRAERAMLDDSTTLLRDELSHLRQECGSFHFETDTSRLEEDFDRIAAQLEELTGRQTDLTGELSGAGRETAACERSIAESENALRETAAVVAERQAQAQLITAKVAGFERLEGALLKDKAKAAETTYAADVAALGEGLKRGDRQALAAVRDIAGRLEQEYGERGGEARELLQLLIAKLSLLQEVEEKVQRAASLKTEKETLRSALEANTAALEKLRALTGEDRKKAAGLEQEIQGLRKSAAVYAEEAAKGNEMSSKRESAVAEFSSLLVEKAELPDKIRTAAKKMTALKDMTEKML
jgi:chromosome segregation ATPase